MLNCCPSKSVKTTWKFWPEQLHQKSASKQLRFFGYRNYIEKSTWKQRGFFDQRNYTNKSAWKQRGFFDHRSYIEKITWKQCEFFDRRNYVKVRGNNVDFLISEITSKKYLEMTRWLLVLLLVRKVHSFANNTKHGTPKQDNVDLCSSSSEFVLNKFKNLPLPSTSTPVNKRPKNEHNLGNTNNNNSSQVLILICKLRQTMKKFRE